MGSTSSHVAPNVFKFWNMVLFFNIIIAIIPFNQISMGHLSAIQMQHTSTGQCLSLPPLKLTPSLVMQISHIECANDTNALRCAELTISSSYCLALSSIWSRKTSSCINALCIQSCSNCLNTSVLLTYLKWSDTHTHNSKRISVQDTLKPNDILRVHIARSYGSKRHVWLQGLGTPSIFRIKHLASLSLIVQTQAEGLHWAEGNEKYWNFMMPVILNSLTSANHVM